MCPQVLKIPLPDEGRVGNPSFQDDGIYASGRSLDWSVLWCRRNMKVAHYGREILNVQQCHPRAVKRLWMVS